MIVAHKLQHSIAIGRRTTTQDRYGASDDVWLPIAGMRAERVTTTTKDFFRASGEGEEALTVFRIRYRTDITLDDRVLHEARVFDIVEIIEIGRRAGLELRVRARS